MTISPMSASVETRRRKSARLTRSDAARLAGARAHQHLALVEEIELAGELALAQDDEDLRQVVLVDVEDLDRAFEDDEEVDAAVAAREHRRAAPRSAPRCRSAATRATISRLRRGKVCASRAIGSLGSSAVSRALLPLALAPSPTSLSAIRAVYGPGRPRRPRA